MLLSETFFLPFLDSDLRHLASPCFLIFGEGGGLSPAHKSGKGYYIQSRQYH